MSKCKDVRCALKYCIAAVIEPLPFAVLSLFNIQSNNTCELLHMPRAKTL